MRGIPLFLFGALRVERGRDLDTDHALRSHARNGGRFGGNAGPASAELCPAPLEILPAEIFIRTFRRPPRAGSEPFPVYFRNGFSGRLEYRSGTSAALLRPCSCLAGKAGSFLRLLFDGCPRPQAFQRAVAANSTYWRRIAEAQEFCRENHVE